MAESLHISVASVPEIDFGNPRLLDHDLRLIKASILYADKVKICSLGPYLATAFYLIGKSPQNPPQRYDMLILLCEMMTGIERQNTEYAKTLNSLREYEPLFKRQLITLTRKEREKRRGLEKMVSEVWKPLQDGFLEGTREMGFDEIEIALSKNLVELHFFSNPADENFAQEYVALLEDLLSSADTYPMLDDQTSNLVRLGLQEGKMLVKNSALKNSKEIGLAADLFDRLPVFDIKMDELLDLREELQPSLIRFRSKIISLSQDIESASWDEDFSADVQNTFRAKVEPELLNIEDQLKSTAFREFWSRRSVDKVGYITSSAVASVSAAAMSTYAFGASIAPYAGIATALATAANFVNAGLSDLKKETNAIEGNGLYFYYRVKKHMGNVKR